MIWLVVGATRGIGIEAVQQLLSRGDKVLATARTPALSPPVNATGNASRLWSLTGTPNGRNLTVLECDVSDEKSILAFAKQVKKLGRIGGVLEKGKIDVVILNAGVLVYPNRISEITFSAFAHHLHTNTIGPLLTAQALLDLSSQSAVTPLPSTLPASPLSPSIPTVPIQIHTLVFISSDSGSTTNFRSFEDGFGAYAASKAALNQGLRHLSAELSRRYKDRVEGKAPVVLAIHPGEVSTDMASNVSLDWEVEGIISPKESVECMLKVIAEKGWNGTDEGGRLSSGVDEGEATFWTWDGKRYPW